MTALLIVLWVVGGLLALVLVIGFTSPRVALLKRSIEIAAAPDQVFPHLNDLRRFVDEWSPWTEKDPAAKHVYGEKTEGVGARYSWEGDPKKVGSGSMEIRESESGRRVKTHLSFKGRGEADAGWTIEDLGGGRVRVTWDFEADNGMNPIGRIFGRMMDRFLGPDYEKGLAKLKAVCERAGG